MSLPIAAYWISFSPMIPWVGLVGLTLVAIGMVGWYYARWWKVLLRGTWWRLMVAKAISLIVVFTIVSNPSIHVTVPDDREFTLVSLNDGSASMGVADCDGRTRLEAAKALVAPDGPAGKTLSEFANVRRYVFSEGPPTTVSAVTDYEVQRGRTDVDGAVEHVFERLGADRLGAALLVTDGIDNVGEPIRNRVRALMAAGVPITCIGVGDPRPGQDVAIAFDAPPTKIRKGKVFRLNAKVTARLRSPQDLRVELFDGTRIIREETIRLGGAQSDATVTFELASVLTGLRAYKVSVQPVPGEFNPFNNIDFIGVEVLPPDLYRCLYFSHSPSWDFKYLRALADSEPKLELSGMIQLAEKNWYRFGFDEEPPKGLPAEGVLNAFDCILFDLTNSDAMTVDEWRRIHEFVQRRGGGLVFLGLPGELPEALGVIPPYSPAALPWTQLGQVPISVGRTSLLLDGGDETLFEEGLYLPEGAPFPQIRKSDLKRAATVGASIEGDDLVVLSGHSVGAGKVGFVAIPDTWKWRMTSDAGNDRFAAFWTRLIAWSTAGPKERLVVQPPSSSRPLGERLTVKANLRTADFLPDNGAKVQALVTLPDGSVEEVECFNNPGVGGQYLGKFSPRQPGMHTMRISVTTADGESLDQRLEYLFSERSGETAPRPMAESVLQNLARMTGGNYYRHDQCKDGVDLPISDRIQRIEKQLPLDRFWAFLLAALLFLVPDWYLRRRTGLR